MLSYPNLSKLSLSLCVLLLDFGACQDEGATYQSPVVADRIIEGVHVAPPAHLRWPPNDEGKYVIQAEGIRLAFTNQGGALTNLWVNGSDGKEIDVALGPDSVEDWAKLDDVNTIGGVLGRYAGIISGASFEIDGQLFNTSANGKNGKSTENGGKRGWGKVPLSVSTHTDNTLQFTVFEAMAGDTNGFPGYVASSLTHTVTPYEWTISFGATPCRTSGRIPVSLSQKIFFNLAGFQKTTAAPVQDGVSEHTLYLPYSGLRFEKDGAGVPTGDLKANKVGSRLDFWSGAKSLENALKGDEFIDEAFPISRTQPWIADEKPVATLYSPLSGVQMELFTDQEALHVETWHKTTEMLDKGRDDKEMYTKNSAISLTMQEWPDALNHPEWLRDNKTLWGPDRLYTMRSKFKFSVK